MEKKIKLILVGLMGVSIIFIFLFLQTLSVKQSIMRERDELSQQNATLNGKLAKLQGDMRNYENKLDSLNKDLTRVSKDKLDVEKKYELANKAKEELVEKVKFLQDQLSSKKDVEVEPVPTDAYWATVLKSKTDLEFQLAKMRDDLKSTQINNEQVLREKGTLEIELKNLKREKEDLKRQLDYSKKLLDSLSQDLVREKNDKNKMQETFSTLRSENTMLLQQIKSLSNRKITLENKLQGLQEDKTNIQRKFSEMQVLLSDKLSQIGSLNKEITEIAEEEKPKTSLPLSKRESVELPSIVVRPNQYSTETENLPLDGKVLAINKENNFAIVDLGEDAGIKLGNKLRVTRNGQHVADIEVMQTRKNISACDIKKEISTIQIGDSVLK